MSRHKGGSVKAGCVCVLRERVLDDLTRWEKPRGKRETCALESRLETDWSGKSSWRDPEEEKILAFCHYLQRVNKLKAEALSWK